jgi:hypothetical protein
MRRTDIEGTDEVTTIPNSLGVCDEWWLFRQNPIRFTRSLHQESRSSLYL